MVCEGVVRRKDYLFPSLLKAARLGSISIAHQTITSAYPKRTFENLQMLHFEFKLKDFKCAPYV